MAKIERTKNASRNIVFGVILKAYQILIPFLMRTAMIYLMGVQYLGLNSLFTSVLQVLNLAELGVGSAMVYSMYKPIAEDDEVTICALMKLYRTYYRVIGGIIAIVGIILTPFISKLISGEVPADINIYILYLLHLGATVFSYWLFAYKNSILQAHQRTDVISKVSLLTNTIQYGLQIFVLWVFRNYYYFVIAMLFTQVLTNIITAYYANRLYPNFKPMGELDKERVREINERIRDLFTAKLGGTIVNSADTIVISVFLGLTSLAIYQNYYFIMNAICGFIAVIFGAVTAGIGNSLISDTMDKNYNDFKKFSFLVCFILCICCCCFIGLYQPFMRMWVGENLMLGYEFVVLFCILFYCLEIAMVWATIKDAAGLWHSDRFRPLIAATFNLVLNIILVQNIGLYGIILSTVLSDIFIALPWLLHNLFSILFKRTMRNYIKNILFYVFTTISCCAICYLITSRITINSINGLLIKGTICTFIPIVIQCLVFRNNEVFIESKLLVKKMLRLGNN